MDYIAQQTPLSVEFFRQEYCSGLPFPPPRDLPDPGIEPKSPASQADSLPSDLFKDKPISLPQLLQRHVSLLFNGKIFPYECRVPKNSQER